MARTAPAPNVPPVPGMCPGVAVAAGGGGGGGAGGKGSRKGKGKKKGKTKNGRRSASGGRKNARNGRGCNGSRSCPGRHPGNRGQVAKGHPVDVATGRVFTDPVTIVALSGPLPFALERAYSSEARALDVGLGHGWTHGLAWQLREHRRHVEVVSDHGVTLEFARLDDDDAEVAANGFVLSRHGDKYALDTADERFLLFEPCDGGFRLARVCDEHGNALALEYEGDRLVEIVDSSGRRTRLSYASGRLVTVETKNAPSQGQWVIVARYDYDDAGDLRRADDGGVHFYSYRDHLLVEHTLPSGITYHFRYDGQARCVETWGDHPDPSALGLDDDVPELLADHETKAKGVLHTRLTYDGTGFTEVVTSAAVERYFGDDAGRADKCVGATGVVTQSFDERGNLVALTDALGATWQWRRDARGAVVETIDPLGRTTVIERNEDGGIHRVIDPAGGVTEVASFPGALQWIDPVGAVYEERRDERGRVVETVAPNGATTRYAYDAAGHLAARTDAAGRTTHSRHDAWGRLVATIAPDGAITSYAYEDSGALASVVHPDGSRTGYEYDHAGRLAAVTDGDRRTTYRWSAADKLVSVCDPNGDEVRLTYDRELRLVGIRNARGQWHRFQRNAAGLIVAETTFDGRVLRYRYDPGGQLVRKEDDRGEFVEYQWDLAGQLSSVNYSDERLHAFEYDALGNVVVCRTDDTEVRYERDALGRVVREVQIVSGEAHEVEHGLDTIGDLRLIATRGHVARFDRDVFGNMVAADLDGAHIAFRRDAAGRTIEQSLPRGGRIEWSFDPEGAYDVVRALRGGDPTFVRSYHYDRRFELVELRDSARGTQRFAYDAAGQLLEIVPHDAQRVLFGYDAAGNVRRADAGTEHDDAGRVTRSGDAEYVWNELGCLAEKIETRPDGERVHTRYEWSPEGWLTAVERSDGTRVEHTYDAHARRLEKRVLRRDELGMQLRARVRYVWSGDRLLQELRHAPGEDVVETTYCFEDDGAVPLAQLSDPLELFFC